MMIELRPVTDADGEFLFRLYASVREEELAVAPWTAAQKEAFLRQQFAAQQSYWGEHYPDAARNLVLVDGRLAGRLYLDRGSRETRVVDVSLLPEFRGRGIGTTLLRDVFGDADGAGQEVTIHVERFNPARRLYVRLGFEEKEEVGIYLRMERPVRSPVS